MNIQNSKDDEDAREVEEEEQEEAEEHQNKKDQNIENLLTEKIDETATRNIDPQLIKNIEDSKTINIPTKNNLISSLLEIKCDNPHEVLRKFNDLNEELAKFSEKQAKDLENYLDFLKDKPILADDIKHGVQMLCSNNINSSKFDVSKLEQYIVNDEYLIGSVSCFMDKIFRKVPKPVQIATRVVWHLYRSQNNNQIHLTEQSQNNEEKKINPEKLL
jgi:hypothetical protein